MFGDMVESVSLRNALRLLYINQAKSYPGKAEVPGSNPGGSTLPTTNISAE